MHEIVRNLMDEAGIAIVGVQGNRTQTCTQENRLCYVKFQSQLILRILADAISGMVWKSH